MRNRLGSRGVTGVGLTLGLAVAVLLRRRPGFDRLRLWMLARHRRSGNTRREFGVGHRSHPGRSAVNPEDVTAELDVLASRVRRMSPPLSRNP